MKFFIFQMYNHTILWLIIIILLILWIFKNILNVYNELKHLNKLPSPKGYPYLGNLDLMWLNPAQLFKAFRKFNKSHYPIYKLTCGYLSFVMITTPDDIEMIISQMKHLKKGVGYMPVHNWLKEGLLLSDGSKWQFRRKLLTPTFHFTILNQFTKTFTEECNKLIQVINKINNKPVDVLSVIGNFTLQSICETAMGTKLEELQAGEEYKKSVYKTGALVIERWVTPWQHDNILHKFTKNFWKSRSLFNYLHKFTRDVIKNREKTFKLSDLDLKENSIGRKNRLAMLDLLLKAKIEGHIDDNGIQEEVDTFMFEGHDTTATSITFSLLLLANYKDVQNRVYDEIKDILNGSNRDFTMDDLNEMNYLERVIKESLRLYPSVPLIGRELSENVTVSSGYFIPKGTMVVVNIFETHRNSDYFNDPEKFDPDRFLPENVKGKHPYCYIPFSAGPRNCIGQKFAMLEMKACIATILKHFELNPVDTPETIEMQCDLVLRPVKPILVEFRSRTEL